MPELAFDTLGASKDLQKAGVERKHAEAIARLIHSKQGDLATKSDIKLLKSDIELLRKDFEQLRKDVQQDISQLRKDVQQDINQLRKDVQQEIGQLRKDVQQANSQLRMEFTQSIDVLKKDNHWIKWVVGLQLPFIVAVATIVVMILK